MAVLMADEQRRKQKNIVYGALISLLVIWAFKLSFPTNTASSVYNAMPSWSKNGTVVAGLESQVVIPPTADYVWNYKQSTFTKIAVLIEDRPMPNAVPLLMHFASVLGPTWPIYIYTSPETQYHYTASAAMQRFLKSGQVQLKLLPEGMMFQRSDDLSSFLGKPWIWEQLAPAEHILMFQTDSILCSRAAKSVEDFFEYDFVGAPIAPAHGEGYNGGLSLRRRSTMLRITTEFQWPAVTAEVNERFEDRWFWKCMQVLMAREAQEIAAAEAEVKTVSDGKPNAAAEVAAPPPRRTIKLPDQQVARTFSVETVDFPHPLGLHQVGRYLKMGETLVNLEDWCPEYKLCFGGPRLG